MNLTRRNE